MGFETERSDEAGRCGLGDWELGSAEAGRRRRPTELATGTDRTDYRTELGAWGWVGWRFLMEKRVYCGYSIEFDRTDGNQ